MRKIASACECVRFGRILCAKKFRHRLADHLVDRKSQLGIINPGKAQIEVYSINRDGSGLENPLQPLLGLPKRLARPHAFGRIPNDGRKETLPFHLPARKGNIHREFGAILSQSVPFDDSPSNDAASVGVFKAFHPMLMGLAIALRHQDLDGLTEHFLLLTTKYGARALVPGGDHPPAIGGNDRIGCRFGDGQQEVLALLLGELSSFELV